MIHRTFSRRRFLQGMAALGVLLFSRIPGLSFAGTPYTSSSVVDGYLAQPMFFSNRQGVIVLADSVAQGQEAADRLARMGFTALVPTTVGSSTDAALRNIDVAASSLKQLVQKVHILGISGSGNLAVTAANRSTTLDRVIVLGGVLNTQESNFSFEAPNRTNTLYLFSPEVGEAEQTWARVARWLSNSGKAV